MTRNEFERFQKSTIGRSEKTAWPVIPGPVRATAGALSRLAPGPCAGLAERLFLTPHRHRVPARESDWQREIPETTFRVNGRRVSGWSAGEGPTVLLVHGWAGRGAQLRAFVEPLVATGFRVVWYDAPGHGRSEGTRSSLPEMAEAVTKIGHDVGPLAGIVAHSLGAAATTVALFDGLRVARCVYLAAPARVSAFPDRFCGAIGFSRKVAVDLKRRIEDRFDVRFDRLDGDDLVRRFEPPPALLVHDRGDPDVPFAEARRLVDHWRGAELIETVGLGHRGVRRDPAVVSRAVSFLSEPVVGSPALRSVAG